MHQVLFDFTMRDFIVLCIGVALGAFIYAVVFIVSQAQGYKNGISRLNAAANEKGAE